MPRAIRRRNYIHRWMCPLCGGEVLLDVMSGKGRPYRVCMTCVDDDGHPVEACHRMETTASPPTRNTRLYGNWISSPLRKTRGR
jgi:phage/plasmid primase-like uncharacterized protein